MAKSTEELAHLEWLGYVQPIGLVVSIPAMLEAQCYVNKNIVREHANFLGCVHRDPTDESICEIRDLREFTNEVLGWDAADLIEVPQDYLPQELAVLEAVIPQHEDRLLPTHAVPTFRPDEGQNPWTMLIRDLPVGTDFDDEAKCGFADKWHEKPHAKFERLLRETGVPIGLMSNRRQIRLVYAPKGESSGFATFNVNEMMQVAGRPMFAALQMLLNSERMFSLGDKQRLPAILENSRKYQNTVSTALAEQVLAALYELMRGFQAANNDANGKLLREILQNNPNQVYSGLLTVLMRLVFVMYAEDRNLISSDPVYSNHYSVTGLFNRLREDAGRFPDTMNQRFGAWAQMITLFRLIYDGGQHGELNIPGRKGYLFDPDRYSFLEGRQPGDEQFENIPRISDGVIFNVLKNLLILDGERLSYRTLDVEQIGSVYETVMGFNLEVAAGKSIAIKPVKTHGAPATINLDELLATAGKNRAKWLKETCDQKLGTADSKQLKDAGSIDELLTALDKKIAKKVTPRVVSSGSIVLQPSDERRRSGSHYTPRSLTEPIVRTTLEPILKQLHDAESELPGIYQPTREDKKRYTKGEIETRVKQSERAIGFAKKARDFGVPHPSQILDLKLCDPAMGSGAFLVEACRQLGDELIKAWYAHDAVPTDIPPDEDEVLYARRLIAQRCLYGVDKNVMAVDLAKLSLWLVTLAKDHAFTFLDHALRHGDSLVGLTREQIIGFHWEVKKQKKFGEDLIQRRLDRATEARAKILNAREDVPYRDQQQRMASADEALDLIRLVGDACVSGFFAGQKKKEREEHAERLFGVASSYLESLTAGRGKQVDFESRRVLGQAAARLRAGSHPIPAFHWEIEFPEVFARENGGFDAFVGNPPFLGCNRISELMGGPVYQHWLKEVIAVCKGSVDLSVFFFRLAYDLLNVNGTLGLLATGSISFGHNRLFGLAYLVSSGAKIYNVITRKPWPGEATVLITVTHITKSHDYHGSHRIDGKSCETINSRLQPQREFPEPQPLAANNALAHNGTNLGSVGFILEPQEACELLDDSKNESIILRLIGGDEVNAAQFSLEERFVICFRSMTLDEASKWPELLEIVRERVLPHRMKQKDHGPGAHGKKYWWQHVLRADPLYRAIVNLDRCLVTSRVSTHHSFRFEDASCLFNEKVFGFAFDSFAAFAMLQSSVHGVWSYENSSRLGFAINYSINKTFSTFPFPKNWSAIVTLHEVGERYHLARDPFVQEFGLTELYNRFHDPHEQSEGILELRRLHSLMDGAVLRAYGWDDLAESARCEFLLDYEEEEDDADAGPPAAGARKKSKKKKPWRLRWPDEFRDEVLARLLELNEQRHKQEQLTGSGVAKPSKTKNTAGRKKQSAKTKNISNLGQQDLGFGDEQ